MTVVCVWIILCYVNHQTCHGHLQNSYTPL